MFPLKNTEAYIHANGYRSTLGKELAARDAEINELGSEIQALTNEVRGNWAIGGVNLFNGKFSVGYNISNEGAIVSNSKCAYTTDLIAVTSNKVTVSFNKALYSVYVIEYGDTDNFIRRDASSTNVSTFTATLSDNCKKIRVAFNYDDSTTVTNEIANSINTQVELGSTATPYQPYAKTNVELTADVNDLNKVTTGTITLSSDYFDTADTSNNFGTWERNGKVVTFFMQGVTKAEVPSGNTNLAQGLPLRVGAPIVGFAYDITNGAANPSLLGQVRITAGASSIINYPFNNAIATGKKIRIFGTYICD